MALLRRFVTRARRIPSSSCPSRRRWRGHRRRRAGARARERGARGGRAPGERRRHGPRASPPPWCASGSRRQRRVPPMRWTTWHGACATLPSASNSVGMERMAVPTNASAFERTPRPASGLPGWCRLTARSGARVGLRGGERAAGERHDGVAQGARLRGRVPAEPDDEARHDVEARGRHGDAPRRRPSARPARRPAGCGRPSARRCPRRRSARWPSSRRGSRRCLGDEAVDPAAGTGRKGSSPGPPPRRRRAHDEPEPLEPAVPVARGGEARALAVHEAVHGDEPCALVASARGVVPDAGGLLVRRALLERVEHRFVRGGGGPQRPGVVDEPPEQILRAFRTGEPGDPAPTSRAPRCARARPPTGTRRAARPVDGGVVSPRARAARPPPSARRAGAAAPSTLRSTWRARSACDHVRRERSATGCARRSRWGCGCPSRRG